jgi:SAM-dependent methyltransferase
VADSYLLSGQASELPRLQLQSRVWEPAGAALLEALGPGQRRAAIDVGCGAMGWLRLLSRWVGPTGTVVGSDLDPSLLAAAAAFGRDEGLDNVRLVEDDLFRSGLPANGFDLVHARFQIAPLGRAEEQLAAYRRLLRAGGCLVLEEPDPASWRVHPDAPAVARLIGLIEEGFRAAGGDFAAGRRLPGLLQAIGLAPRIEARVIALEGGHPYLALPLQFARSLGPRLEALVGASALAALVREAADELQRPGAWGTTFTLIQAFATLAG